MSTESVVIRADVGVDVLRKHVTSSAESIRYVLSRPAAPPPPPPGGFVVVVNASKTQFSRVP